MLFKVIPYEELVETYVAKQRDKGKKPIKYYVGRLVGDQNGTYTDIHRGTGTKSELLELQDAFKSFLVNPSLENQVKVYEEMGDILFHLNLLQGVHGVGYSTQKGTTESTRQGYARVYEAEAFFQTLVDWGWSEETAEYIAATKFSLRLYRSAAGLPPKDKDMELGFMVRSFSGGKENV